MDDTNSGEKSCNSANDEEKLLQNQNGRQLFSKKKINLDFFECEIEHWVQVFLGFSEMHQLTILSFRCDFIAGIIVAIGVSSSLPLFELLVPSSCWYFRCGLCRSFLC
ncbi:hypothetical protein C2G38_2026934 [Gigaspora rosea]|uniref:Uncharacterized protein n=1 Tax=Gigaspora rosea TaxID=44941 RepID=A0A397W7R8_9GLOM|nr:hypothetical protein C2G38_2026934 [Gigaspora rosea]